MRFFAKILVVFSGLLFLILLYSCQEEITPPNDYVNIHLTDQYGFDYITNYGEYPNITIGDYPIYLTDGHGNCKIPNVKPPYDISMFCEDQYYTYKHVTRKDPIVTFLDEFSYNSFIHSNECFVHATFPHTSSTLVIVKFLSNEKFLQNNDYILSGEQLHSAELNIRFTENVNEIHGKLLVLYCYGIFNGNSYYYVTHYMYYASKDIVLHAGDNPNINFTENDLKPLGNFYNSHFQVNYPTIANSWKMTSFLSFPGFDKSSDVPIYTTFYDNDNLTLPKGLPYECNLKMLSYYSIGSIYGYHRPHRLTTAPIDTTGTQTTFVINHCILDQNMPADGVKNVDDNTVFSYSDNLIPGIYVIDLYDSRQHITSVFTDKESIRFAELKSRGFTPNPNTLYYWTVSKFTSFSSMDDFLSSNICYRPDFDAISGSDVRSFRTTP